MKKCVAFIMASYIFFGSLFPGYSFFEFSELPLLIKHYQHHKNVETPGIGFIDFMVMHYADYKHEQSDPVNHNRLPSHHGFTTAINDQVLPSSVLINAPVNINKPVKLSNTNHLFIPLRIAGTIFHPPKV